MAGSVIRPVLSTIQIQKLGAYVFNVLLQFLWCNFDMKIEIRIGSS